MNLTLFSTAKPFRGQEEIQQSNAIETWMQIEPRPEIMLYGNEPGVGTIAQRLGAIHHDNVVTLDDVPLLDSLFSQAQNHASNDYLVYVNADVMVIDGLVEAVQRMAETFTGGFLGICRRWDIQGDEPLDFSRDWRAAIKEEIADNGELHSTCSSDLFAFKRPLWDLLPFTVGRPEWDNWIFWKATDSGIPVVDLTPVVITAHAKHKHGPNRVLEAQTFWRTDHLAQRNRKLGGHGKQYCYRHIQKAGYLWQMTKDAIERI